MKPTIEQIDAAIESLANRKGWREEMTEEKSGGYAFPVTDHNGVACYGMTLRDWLAGMALHGLLASSHIHEVDKPALPSCLTAGAAVAYQQADAMIKKRKEK